MIAKEGFPFILGAIIALIVFIILPREILVVLTVLTLLLFLWFFRDPERKIPTSENVAVSAADGKVVEVSQSELDGVKYQKVSVFMNVFSVHVNRVPLSGVVKSVNHIEGKFLNAAKPEASVQNERTVVVFDTAHGDIVCVQVAGLVARRTVCNVQAGDSITTGDRFGMIKFSSRVDHYFPLDFNITVREDDVVKAGESILATF